MNKIDLLRIASNLYDFSYTAFDYLLEDMYGDKDWIDSILDITTEITNNEIDEERVLVFGDLNGCVIRLHLLNILDFHINRYLNGKTPNSYYINIIKSHIVGTLVHELFHLNQNLIRDDFLNLITDVYKDDEDSIQQIVEQPVEYMTLEYCARNKYKIKEDLLFNFAIEPNVKDINYAYESCPKDMYIVKAISTLGSDVKINKILYDACKKYKSVFIAIAINNLESDINGDKVWCVKNENIYYPPSKFILHQLRRYNQCAKDLYVSGSEKDKDTFIIDYIITPELIKPIERLKPCN